MAPLGTTRRQLKPSLRFTGYGKCWRWLGSRDWNRSCRMWTASTTGKSSARSIALEPAWFPAVENRGEGILVQLRADAVSDWLGREPVKQRLNELIAGHNAWAGQRKSERSFPGGPYVLLHTLAHLLSSSRSPCDAAIRPLPSENESLSMRRARAASGMFPRRAGVASGTCTTSATPCCSTPRARMPKARWVVWSRRPGESRTTCSMRFGLRRSVPTIRCARSMSPAHSMEERWLHGAACHGCTLIAETSCEMRNEYLDRALAVPTLYAAGAAFFGAP